MNIYLFIFIISVIIYFYTLSSTKCAQKKSIVEGLDESTGGYCLSCDNLTFGQCMKCYNCGFCGNSYKGKCVNGTMTGPNKVNENVFTVKFDRSNNPTPYCPRYYNNDNFWRYLNLEKSHVNENAGYAMKAYNDDE